MLAIIFFLFGVCIKCYSWVRDQDRTKARGQLDFEDDELNYSIITAGEQGYKEVDIRNSSNELESDSDVTDSGLVAEPEKSVPHSCFKHPIPTDPDSKGQSKEVLNKRLQRFKTKCT
nr:hypothetical protein BaRGS_007768 [Batillaria attramentaria]